MTRAVVGEPLSTNHLASINRGGVPAFPAARFEFPGGVPASSRAATSEWPTALDLPVTPANSGVAAREDAGTPPKLVLLDINFASLDVAADEDVRTSLIGCKNAGNPGVTAVVGFSQSPRLSRCVSRGFSRAINARAVLPVGHWAQRASILPFVSLNSPTVV